VFPGFA
jgi:hypothetical protein